MTPADTSSEPSSDRLTGDRVAPAARSGPRAAQRTGQTLGIAWLHGSTTAAVFRRQALAGSCTIPRPVHTVEEFGAALDEILASLEFAGTEVFLVLEHAEFSHQTEATPIISESAARTYLKARIARHEQDHGRVVWSAQKTISSRQESSYLLHLLPVEFFDRLSQAVLARRLELIRILPLVVPLQSGLGLLPGPRNQPVLVAADMGAATTILVGTPEGRVAFARTLRASWSSEPARVGVEVNRSLLYAKQKLGTMVNRIWLLGGDDATAEVRAKCGEGKEITAQPAAPTNWLQAVAGLSPRDPVNLLAGHLQWQHRRGLIRRALGAAGWLGLVLMGAAAWTDLESARADDRRFARLRTEAPMLRVECDRLAERNREVTRARDFIQQVVNGRLPPVPARFLAYLASLTPTEGQWTDFRVERDDSSGRWSFRLAGTIETDEETARASLGALQQRLETGPFRAHFNESTRLVTATRTDGGRSPLELQSFNLEGILFEPAELARGFWLLLTAVPGWPDAPGIARVGRTLPIVFPFAIMLILAGWKVAVGDPHLQAARAENRPLLLLESQIAALRMNCSEQEAHELTARATALMHSLASGPEKLMAILQSLQEHAKEQHWEPDFHAIEGGGAAPVDGAQVAFVRLKGKLVPTPDNTQPFSTLVMLLDGLSREEPRIDLTRLGIRADEQGRYSVETHLRLAYQVSHEKAAQ